MKHFIKEIKSNRKNISKEVLFMDKIVSHGLKIDLHIHSCESSKKDGNKVRNNTVENIPILINKLNENGVNICSITDHDTFSYRMYSSLKKAESDNSSIKKVFPGVEFSVSFLDYEDKEQIIHIITIFSDNDETRIQKIEDVLKKHKPNKNGCFTEENFLVILREIDLDTILIAHQKNTLSSKKPRKHDISSLGESKFLEIVASDYFEAFEFKNKRNQVLNKNYLLEKGIDDRVRFVTGTDCHDWSVYPKETPSDPIIDFPYTFAKCLPSFRGLVMALTDQQRLKTVDSFFNVDKKTIEKISLEHNGKTVNIPLSKGINVIIGDNSIGKSMLLHALTGFEKDGEKISSAIQKGYKAYLKKNNLKIKKTIKKKDVFAFDMQGEVRKKFENNLLVSTEFSNYFPDEIDPKPYKTIIDNEIERLISFLDEKFKIEKEIKKLSTITIYIDEESSESLSFVGDLRSLKENSSNISTILSKFQQLIFDYSEILKQPLDESDIEVLTNQLDILKEMHKKYQSKKSIIDCKNQRIETIAKVIDDVAKTHNKSISDKQKKKTSFMEKTLSIQDTLKTIILYDNKNIQYTPTIKEAIIPIASNIIQDYAFVSKLNVKELNNDYFLQHVNGVFKRSKAIDFNKTTETQLKNSLKQYDNSSVLHFFKDSISKSFDEDFSSKQTILLGNSDKAEEFSAGLNSKIYFDLLSYENSSDGIYIIDQPEDNVSQPSIKEYLLDCFKTMGENRQVIMVSHNPQFIVNLDIDNLIFLYRNNSGELSFQSGALEYECDEYSVLQIVADNIDGGLDSIQKRWKRYEKNNRI